VQVEFPPQFRRNGDLTFGCNSSLHGTNVIPVSKASKYYDCGRC
jgi:hypothetical protein